MLDAYDVRQNYYRKLFSGNSENDLNEFYQEVLNSQEILDYNQHPINPATNERQGNIYVSYKDFRAKQLE